MKRIVQIAITTLSIGVAFTALAQSRYPDKPIRIIVGFTPGTSTDLLPRLVSTRLGEALGQPVVVENKPGAGSSIAAEMVARSAPDGYTLLASSSANTINPSLYKLSFDFERDLVPIGAIAEAPLLVVVHPSVGAQNVQQLIAAAKAKPGGLTYGSSGIGTFIHLNGELFKMSTGTHIAHVPYKGSSQAIGDLLSSLPAFTCEIAVDVGAKITWIWPLNRSPIACELPLYGTWPMWVPVLILNSSPFR